MCRGRITQLAEVRFPTIKQLVVDIILQTLLMSRSPTSFIVSVLEFLRFALRIGNHV